MKRGILFLLCTVWSSYFLCHAQRTADPLQVLQRAIQNFEDEISEEALVDMLDNPLRINLATLAELEEFPLFTRFMAVSLHDYIQRNGFVLSIFELGAVPGFNSEVAASLSPFIDLTTQKRFTISTFRHLLADGRSQLILRGAFYTKIQEGYLPITEEALKLKPDSRYIGTPGRVYAQYKFDVPGRVRFTLTSEKDPGEKLGDYIGYSMQVENIGVVSKAVFGDFTARFGQGLVLWNAPSLFSSAAPTALIKQEFGLSSYSSTDENRSFRGAGITISTSRVNFSILGSSKSIDARITDDGFTSLLTTGLHNTSTTLERRKNLKLNAIGANCSFNTSWLKVGVSAAAYRYSHPYAGRDSSQIYRQSAFGNFGANAGADFYAYMSNFRLFGEFASDLSGNPAIITGLSWRKSYNFDISAAVRFYSDEYLSPFGGALSKSGKMRGERAVDLSLTNRGYKGNFVRGWLSYAAGMKLPRAGFELSYPISDANELLVKADYRDGRGALRLQTEWEISRILKLNVRGEANISESDTKPTYGWMAYTELIAGLPSGFADGSARVAYFNTPEWENRIYAYERDLLYGFSVPALYGRGIRCYLNFHCAAFSWMDIWLKGSFWHYTDREYTGEGPTRMEGPSSFEIKWEARFRF